MLVHQRVKSSDLIVPNSWHVLTHPSPICSHNPLAVLGDHHPMKKCDSAMQIDDYPSTRMGTNVILWDSMEQILIKMG